LRGLPLFRRMAGLESQKCWQVGPAQDAPRPERFRAAEGPCQHFVRPGGESRHPPQIRSRPRLRGLPRLANHLGKANT
jgi:hypothetical protein